MAKKSKAKRTSHARHAPARPRPARASAFRNAAPPAPRVKKSDPDDPVTEIIYTLGSAYATAFAVSVLRDKGWEPKSAAATLGAGGVAGAFLAKDNPHVRRLSTGIASAAGSQFAMMLVDDHEAKKRAADQAAADQAAADQAATIQAAAQAAADKAAATPPAQLRPANAGHALPPGALDAALARAQARLALADGY